MVKGGVKGGDMVLDLMGRRRSGEVFSWGGMWCFFVGGGGSARRMRGTRVGERR